MFLAFIVWIYIAFIGYSYGNLYVFLLKKLHIVEKETTLNFFFLTLSGLGFLSSIVGLISIFYRITIEVNVVLTLIALLSITLYPKHQGYDFAALKNKYEKKWSMLIIGLIYGVFVLFLGTVGDFHTDTGQYHAQAVKWTENYPVVYGLANLFGRLGYNSMFHVLSAFFSLTFLNVGSFRLLNSFFLLFLGWRVIDLWFGQQRNGFQWLYLCVLLMAVVAFRGALSSLATDNVVTVLTYFVFIEFIEKMRHNAHHKLLDVSFWGILMLLLLIVTTKISVAPVGALIIYMGWQAKIWTSPRALIGLFAVAGLAILPWLGRNVILSGYLVYPFPAIDIFDVDWKVPKNISLSDTYTSTNSIESDRNWIYSYAFNADIERINWRDFVKLPLLEKYKQWFALHTVRHSWFLGVLIFFPVVMLFFTSKNGLLNALMRGVGWVAYLGCVFLFFNAPDVRFCIPFLMICSLVMLFSVIKSSFFLSNLILPFYKVAWIVFFALWLFFVVKDYRFGKVKFHENFVFEPASYPQVRFAEYKIDNIVQYVAPAKQRHEYSCWDAPLPCSDHFKPYLELRGATMAEGFKVNWDKIRLLEASQKSTKLP